MALSPPTPKREKEMSSMIKDLENKHGECQLVLPRHELIWELFLTMN